VTDATKTTANLKRQGFALLNQVALPMPNLGIGNPLPIGPGAVAIQTTGRVSGKARTVPLLSWRCGNYVLVSTVRPTSQWFANLEADPSARVQLHGRFRPASATPVRGPLNIAVLRVATAPVPNDPQHDTTSPENTP
jgi:deazaflavin-dependent oxidoreductase (nitroreductase family)